MNLFFIKMYMNKKTVLVDSILLVSALMFGFALLGKLASQGVNSFPYALCSIAVMVAFIAGCIEETNIGFVDSFLTPYEARIQAVTWVATVFSTLAAVLLAYLGVFNQYVMVMVWGTLLGAIMAAPTCMGVGFWSARIFRTWTRRRWPT